MTFFLVSVWLGVLCAGLLALLGFVKASGLNSIAILLGVMTFIGSFLFIFEFRISLVLIAAGNASIVATRAYAVMSEIMWPSRNLGLVVWLTAISLGNLLPAILVILWGKRILEDDWAHDEG